MKYLKYFKQTSAYEAYKNGSDFITPNVSYVEDDDKVYYHALVLRNNVITYQADSKLYETTSTSNDSGLHVNAFNSSMISHEFADGVGTITFEGEVTTIDHYAFYGCKKLTSIVIPDSVTSIGWSAFRDCSGLTSIVIPDSVTSIKSSTFNGCSSLTSINIPDGVTSIDTSAFEGCKKLTSINIPDGVTSIEISAFYGCSSLTSINIPDSVKTIGWSAFEGCSSLASINIPGSVTYIDSSVFARCSSLTEVTIGSGVTYIGGQVFADCSNLTSINIPDSVTTIDNETFRNCLGLTEIEYNGYMYQWQNINLIPSWRNQSAIERVICLDGVIELNTTAVVSYIGPYDWDINLNVGDTHTLGFDLYDTSKSSITTAVYGDPKSVDGNYYYYQYNDDAISVTDYGYDGKSGYYADIHAKKPGTYYLDIYAGPGVKGDAMYSIAITIS